MAQGLNVTVTNGMPDMRVRVNPGTTIGFEDGSFSEGDELTVSGPVAQSWEAEGHVTIIPKKAKAKK